MADSERTEVLMEKHTVVIPLCQDNKSKVIRGEIKSTWSSFCSYLIKLS